MSCTRCANCTFDEASTYRDLRVALANVERSPHRAGYREALALAKAEHDAARDAKRDHALVHELVSV